MEDDNNIEIEDAENYRGSKDSGKSFRQIVMELYNRCLMEFSKEMTWGGTKRVLIEGRVQTIVCPNQPQICFNTANSLRIALKPTLDKKKPSCKMYEEFDDKSKEISKELESKQKQIQTALQQALQSKEGAANTDYYQSHYNELVAKLQRDYDQKMIVIYQNHLLCAISTQLAEMNYFEEEGVTI